MGYDYKTDPFRHQRDALNVKSLHHSRSAWAAAEFFWRMDMGTGKSKVAIDNVSVLFERDLVDGFFILAPKTVCGNWIDEEIPAHMPDRVPRLVLMWKPKSDRNAAWARKWRELLDFKGLAVLVMNYDALVTDTGRKDAERFLRTRRTFFVADESIKLKNPKAKRTKAACKLSPLASYRRAMSGMPVTRDPLDLWGQCEFLKHGILGDTNYFSFRSRYAILREMYLNGRRFQKIEGFQRLPMLREILNSFSFRVRKEDCLDLPPKIYTTRHVEMTPEQARVYRSMAHDFEAEINGGMCTTTNVLARITRLQQILCGYLKTDDGQVHELPHNRLNALLETIEEAGDSKVIVWAPAKPDVYRIAKALDEKYGRGAAGVLTGDQDGDERAKLRKAFQGSDWPRFIVGTPETGGIGLTLTRARVVVYYQNEWDLGIRAQSEDRAHRIGQDKPVTYVDLVVPGTVEVSVIAGLRAKKSLAEAVAENPKAILRRAA